MSNTKQLRDATIRQIQDAEDRAFLRSQGIDVPEPPVGPPVPLDPSSDIARWSEQFRQDIRDGVSWLASEDEDDA